MKQRILIFSLLAFCILLICIGIVKACENTGQTDKAAINSDNSESSRKDRHIDNLDDVTIPASISSQIAEYTGFRLSFNKENRTPNWVAWELLGTETDGEFSRSNKFWQDPDIDGCPSAYDYKGSGYDRGHMCPAADQKWSRQAMDDCFSFANMCPQDHSLNSGAWSTLENKERLWAQRDSALVIVAGPIFNSVKPTTIGEGVRVPDAFFKAILAPYAKAPRAIAFVYPNMSSPGNMRNYAMSVDQLEELTGYDFFSSLPDEIENKVESTTSFTEWDRF